MPAKCLTCTNPITPSFNGSIICTVCQKDFHAECVELNAVDLDFLELSKNAWKCQVCLSKSRLRNYSTQSLTPPTETPITTKHFHELMQAIQAMAADLSGMKESYSLLKADIGTIREYQSTLETQFPTVREHLETHSNALSEHGVLIDANTENIQELEASPSAIEVRVTALVDEVNPLDVPTSSAISKSTPEILTRVKRSHNIMIKGIAASEDRLNGDMILRRCVNHIAPTPTYAIETFPIGSDF
ncbi:hypothetical protein HHI36_003197 [Cryptolaemus montrouzieri]|uniref:PHD-type domain-containing protein n=1 Tax=Cryptolaemus montrouzieri TaxID=559131 RepID=A0ABD2PDK2_9CUCU